MWSLIEESKIDNFVNKYPKLKDFKNDIKLLNYGKYIFLPKFTYLNNPHPDIIQYRNPNFKENEITDIKFEKPLREEQIGMVAPFLQMYNVSNIMTGCLKARPGAGKTVMGIYLACYIKKVCLILINNTNLADQWKNTILNFTNCTEDDIGEIRSSKFDTENKKFIIATVQTFCSKIKRDASTFYNKVSQIGIGCVLYDECHHSISGPKYALSSLILDTNNIIGLSATPYVFGLHEFLMSNTVGQIISDTTNYNLVPKITIIKFNSNLNDKVVKSLSFSKDLIKIRARYNSVIVNSQEYMNVITSLNKSLLNKGHRLINILFTKQQVNLVSEYLLLNGIDNIKYYSEQRELNKETDKNLVATYQFAGEGFDYSQLSACLIAIPLTGKKSLIQVIGRVLRSHSDKISPEVIILVDTRIGNTFTRDIPKISNVITEEFKITPNVMTWEQYKLNK